MTACIEVICLGKILIRSTQPGLKLSESPFSFLNQKNNVIPKLFETLFNTFTNIFTLKTKVVEPHYSPSSLFNIRVIIRLFF